MKRSIAILVLILIAGFRFKPDVKPLLSPVTYEGWLFTEALIENTTLHDVRIEYYDGGSASARTSFSIASGHRVPLQPWQRYDTDPPIDSAVLFFRNPDIDSLTLIFDERYRVTHYCYNLPMQAAPKHYRPGVLRNLLWIGSWCYQRYIDPVNAKLIDGFRYQITDENYRYASN